MCVLALGLEGRARWSEESDTEGDMPEQWPDEMLISELDIGSMSLAELLLRAGVRTVGEARRLSESDYGRLIGEALRGPRCNAVHPQSAGKGNVGICVYARHHQGEHADIWNHRWGDRDAIPDELEINELELPVMLANRLSEAGLLTAGAVRASPQDVKGIGEKGWAYLRAMGLRPDSCGSASPRAPQGAGLSERRCILPAHHQSEHKDLQGRRWSAPRVEKVPIESEGEGSEP